MVDHLKKIEDEKGQIDLGVMIARVYAGALQETEDSWTAFIVTVAYCRGLFGASNDKPEEEDGSN